MKNEMSVAQVATASGVDATTLRNWLAHSEFKFGSRGITGRWSFDRRDAIGIAVAGQLVAHGQSPKRALVEARRLVDRASDLDVLIVASTNSAVSAMLVPLDTELPSNGAVIIVPLAEIRGAVDARTARRA